MGRGTRRRVKISATLDPVILDGVDAFVERHPERDRSSIIDEALSLWLARKQDEAMAEQFAGEGPPADESLVWRAVQREAVRRALRRAR